MKTKSSLTALIRELRDKLSCSDRTVASKTVFGGSEKTMRQTLIVLAEGGELAEHESPGEATIFVLDGRIRLVAGQDSWEGRTGDLLIIPDARHSVEAVEDAAFVLNVAVR